MLLYQLLHSAPSISHISLPHLEKNGFPSLHNFARLLLTAAHNALRAQVRSEGGVRIQRSASILAAGFFSRL